ncbi:MAG: hypothetical protein RL490_1864 [Pseudomonadota bacterium]
MRILALSTASPALSLALFEDDVLVGNSHDVIGRGHAERTLPAIVALLGDHRADAIIIDIGPGSFTGIRIGIAAARALGLAWGVPVTGCSGSALVAAQAFAAQPALAMVTVCLDAGRGLLLRQQVTRHYHVSAPIIVPAGTALLVGACAGPMAGTGAVHPGQPDARFALDLPLSARAHSPQAIYVRPPDAILPL